MTQTERSRKWRKLNHDKWLSYSRSWSKANPACGRKSAKKWHKRTQIKNRIIVDRIKNRPCKDCHGWFEPCQMQFDHRDRTTKLYNVARMVGLTSVKVLLHEIAKCDIVCANCHCLRTWGNNVRESYKSLVQSTGSQRILESVRKS